MGPASYYSSANTQVTTVNVFMGCVGDALVEFSTGCINQSLVFIKLSFCVIFLI